MGRSWGLSPIPVSTELGRAQFMGPRAAGSTGGECRRGTLADWVRLGASFLVLAIVAGCAAPGGALPPLPLARDLPADTNLRLPATRPPNLIDAGLSSGNDTPIISFYSLDEPIVSVCEAAQQQCLSLLPTSRVVPRSDTGPDVTVLIEARENGVIAPLSDELGRYWTEVDLIVGRPDWLDVP